jgi:DNA-binding MarR family transcriptional regulator
MMSKNKTPVTRRVGDEELDELVTALLTASRVLVGVSARSLNGLDEGVTITQFRTLVVLGAHGATRLNRLAERLGVNASTALRTVDKLVAGGFVERRENEQDRREVVIEQTSRGRQLVDRVTARRREAIEDIVVAMPVGHRRHLVDALLSFAAAADEPVAFADSGAALGW